MIAAARHQLENVILPYWLDHGPDEEYGGFFTCYDNRGSRLVSTDKYTWSQGRFVWLLARAARLARAGLIDVDADSVLALAQRGADFLAAHAVREDGTCHYVLGKDGTPAVGPSGETHSVYADCFVVMGLVELAASTGETTWLGIAEPILRRASDDIAGGRADTPPYAVPEGFTAFGPRMILANTWLEYVRALDWMGLLDASATDRLAHARAAMLSHRLPDGTFQEMMPDSAAPEVASQSLVARHRVPGHALEGLWIALEAGRIIGDESDVPDLLASVDALCRSAWDPAYGGLLRFVDADGPDAPSGTSSGSAYEELVGSTWDTKLWWVHTEAAYTSALAAQRYGDEAAAGWAQRIWDYTIATFPGGDDGAEWIQIRDREGRPLDQVVALPVKDPYHIARNLMQLVALGA